MLQTQKVFLSWREIIDFTEKKCKFLSVKIIVVVVLRWHSCPGWMDTPKKLCMWYDFTEGSTWFVTSLEHQYTKFASLPVWALVGWTYLPFFYCMFLGQGSVLHRMEQDEAHIFVIKEKDCKYCIHIRWDKYQVLICLNLYCYVVWSNHGLRVDESTGRTGPATRRLV
jgi:hypothetical protein